MPYFYRKNRVSAQTVGEVQGWIDDHRSLVDTYKFEDVRKSPDKHVLLQVSMATPQQERDWLAQRLGGPSDR